MALQMRIKHTNRTNVTASFREYNTRMNKKPPLWVKMMLDKFVQYAKEGCPVKTGELKESIGNPSKGGIYRISPGGFSGEAGSAVKQAVPVEMGISQPYIIEPKQTGPRGGELKGKKQTLAWKDEQGVTRFAKRVIHPPTKGKHFMLLAAHRARRETLQEMGKL